jgi:hypothetical protein
LLPIRLVHSIERINIRNNSNERLLTSQQRIFIEELVKKFPAFVEHESSSPCSHVPEIWPHLISEELVPQIHIRCLQNQF